MPMWRVAKMFLGGDVAKCKFGRTEKRRNADLNGNRICHTRALAPRPWQLAGQLALSKNYKNEPETRQFEAIIEHARILTTSRSAHFITRVLLCAHVKSIFVHCTCESVISVREASQRTRGDRGTCVWSLLTTSR